MKNPFKFDMCDERDEKEDVGQDQYLSIERQTWLAGILAKLYERMVEAQQAGEAAPEGELDARGDVQRPEGGRDSSEGSFDGEPDTEMGPDSGSDFSAGSFWSGSGDFNF